MIYAKVDVKLRDHVRAHKAGAAMSTWLWALLYAREQETDGLIPEIALKLAWAGEKDARRHADTLVAVGLWEKHDDGWRILKYEAKNETKAAIETRRAEARERMYRVRSKPAGGSQSVRANIERTSGELTETVSRTVPGSGSGSGSDLGSREGVQGEVDPPPWFLAAIATAEGTGETIRPKDAWLRYSGHRAGKGIPKGQQDAVYWLTTVMVPEARKERRDAAERREREARWDRAKGGPPEPAPPPTAAEAEANAAKLAERIAARKAREATKGAA